MKKLLILIIALIMSIPLLLSGCGLTTPECPDCVCPECPDCICSGCPDCVCPAVGKPEIIFLKAEPDTLICDDCCENNGCLQEDCDKEIIISWKVVNACQLQFGSFVGYDNIDSFTTKCWQIPKGGHTYTLTAKNYVGITTATVTITRLSE